MRKNCPELFMRRMIILIALFFSDLASANIQQRVAIFTQQAELFREICFLPNGDFLQDRVLFDVNSSIAETAMDCNAQALALEAEQQAIEAELQSPNCPADARIDDTGLLNLLNGTTGVVTELTCPGIGTANDCASGVACNLLTSIIPVGAAAARFAFPDSPLMRSCSGTGSCFSNIGKAIWDNLWDTVTGLYNLGAMGVSWVGDQIGSLWRAEDQTSTRGIAATEVSDSQLDQFLADPINYIYNFGKRLIDQIISSISSRYGCAEWSGLPHISECVQPMSWDCANCNEKINMICGVAGYIGANFITNFFTGGAIAATQIAGKIAASAVFTVARTIPGAARIAETMAAAGRLSRVSSLITGSLRNAWTAVRASRTVQGVGSIARQLRAAGAVVNGFARKKIFLYAAGQDGVIAAVKAYHRLAMGAFRAGYRSTGEAANRTQTWLYSQYPKLSDITAGRYARVATPQDYFREATKAMSAEERSHMSITVTRDAAGERRVVIHDNRAGSLDSDISFNFSPQQPPIVVARATTPTAAVRAEETIVVTASRTPPTPEKFVELWSERTATTTLENRTFISGAARGEQPGLFYLDTQNTALKRLNDTLRNKQLVDSLGNRYNDLVMQALEDFRAAHPGVTVDLYSDYKSLRAAIRGPPGQEAALMEELAGIIDRTGETFLAEVRRNNFIQLEEGERWFRAGLGRTVDEANLVTRFSRRTSDAPTITFNSIGAQTRIRESWQLTEQSRNAIQRRFGNSPMMRRVEGTDLSIPTAEVLEVVRKNSDPDTIARILSGRYNQTVSRADAEMLTTYFERVDQFSPGLMIPSRVEHRFDQATHGGFSIDFAGVGSVNAEATARGLAQGRTVRDSLGRIREQEILVTRDLDALKARTERAVRTTLSRHGIYADITISGDDMVVVPTRALTPEIRREIAEAQASAQVGTATAPSGMRTSFFTEGIPDQASRSIQATIGESVEKKLRSRLEGQLRPEELRQTLFAVEMRGTSPGTGGVGLQTVNPNLSPASRAIIDREFQNAVEAVNTELRNSGQVGSLNNLGTKVETPAAEEFFSNLFRPTFVIPEFAFHL